MNIRMRHPNIRTRVSAGLTDPAGRGRPLPAEPAQIVPEGVVRNRP